MKKLMRYMTAYKKEAILAPLFKMLEASFELSCPLLWQQSLTRVSVTGTFLYLEDGRRVGITWRRRTDLFPDGPVLFRKSGNRLCSRSEISLV